MWARYPQRLVRLVLEVTNLLDMFTAPDDSAAQVITNDDEPPASPRQKAVPMLAAA